MENKTHYRIWYANGSKLSCGSEQGKTPSSAYLVDVTCENCIKSKEFQLDLKEAKRAVDKFNP